MNTIRTLFFAGAFFVSLVANSQNILDFYLILPDSVMGLSQEERNKIVEVSKDNKSSADASEDIDRYHLLYSFDLVDVKNGFLHIIGAMEGHIEMCYWNLQYGRKLVAIYQEGCGPECYVERFDFYEYDGREFKTLFAESIIPDIYDDFFSYDKTMAQADMEAMEISANLLFALPRKGKNILAKWGNTESAAAYEKFARGNRMMLIWKDGIFEKSEIYWE